MKCCVVSGGWLANKLFIFAQFIAWAEENNILVTFPTFAPYSPFFVSSSHTYSSVKNQHKKPYSKPTSKFYIRISNWFYYFARICFRLKMNNALISCHYLDHGEELILDKQFFSSMRKSKIVLFQGWLFRVPDDIIQKHKDKIRMFFQVKPLYSEIIENLFMTFSKISDLVIGVHVRQGDYKTFENGKYFFTPADYYKQMQQLVALFPGNKIKFLICSDEKQDEKDFPDLDVYISNEHYVTDMYLLAKCNYIMGPPSTFSMWASFYGGVPLYMIKDIARKINLKDFVSYMETDNEMIGS